MTYTKVEIAATIPEQEILIASLDEHEALGFEQTDNTLTAYFPASFDFGQKLPSLLRGFQHTVSEVEERNWNEEWERSFEPIVIGGFCAVRAAFHQPITTVEHEIIITPKMSFGTGHHATTYMMLAQMAMTNLKGKQVFDFGTGTGVLAILAHQLGALQITAIDNDAWSIANAEENFAQNHVSRAQLLQYDQIPEKVFDIILANINLNVILQNMPRLAAATRKGGQCVISGILVDDEEAVTLKANTYGLFIQKKRERDQWLMLSFVNSGLSNG